MLIVTLTDQLGNQMFAYASVKAICLEKGYPFRCYRIVLPEKYINDAHQKYGSDLTTIFSIPASEIIQKLPEDFAVYQEPPVKLRRYNYQKEAKQVSDNTIMNGHFISVKYFEKYYDKLSEWFLFPTDIYKQVQQKVSDIRKQFKNRTFISTHFRVGKDYTLGGFKLDYHYWKKAAKQMKNRYENPLFLLFYDKKNSDIRRFQKSFECLDVRSSFINDLCFMSLCDAHIICNSSFSIMGALLNSKESLDVIRPSVYPVSNGFYPQDCFKEEWNVVKARRSFSAAFYNGLRYWKKKIWSI